MTRSLTGEHLRTQSDKPTLTFLYRVRRSDRSIKGSHGDVPARCPGAMSRRGTSRARGPRSALPRWRRSPPPLSMGPGFKYRFHYGPIRTRVWRGALHSFVLYPRPPTPRPGRTEAAARPMISGEELARLGPEAVKGPDRRTPPTYRRSLPTSYLEAYSGMGD
jgi:hypothetical protein